MKTRNKTLLLMLCAVLLVAGSVLGTYAYLTSSDSVTNTFTVGNVVISLDEAPVDANGDATTGERVQENTYKLLPGHEYDKDPTIHVAAGSEDCWLFVQVVNDIADIEADTTIAAQMAAKGWKALADSDNFYYREATNKAGDNVVVFETVTIKGDVTNEQLAAFANETVTVTAYAVQADGFDTAADAWAAAPFAAE